MSASAVHEVRDGFCVVCGSNIEWLLERYGEAAVRAA